MQRKLSNKENVNPQLTKKECSLTKPAKPKGNSSKTPSLTKSKSHSKDISRSTQRQLSSLKSEVRRMRKQVELFKTYYLTHTQSYHSSEESEAPESLLRCQPELRREERSSEEYLINGSQWLGSREQSQYYIQYYLDN